MKVSQLMMWLLTIDSMNPPGPYWVLRWIWKRQPPQKTLKLCYKLKLNEKQQEGFGAFKESYKDKKISSHANRSKTEAPPCRDFCEEWNISPEILFDEKYQGVQSMWRTLGQQLKNRKMNGVGRRAVFPFGLVRASQSAVDPTPGKMDMEQSIESTRNCSRNNLENEMFWQMKIGLYKGNNHCLHRAKGLSGRKGMDLFCQDPGKRIEPMGIPPALRVFGSMDSQGPGVETAQKKHMKSSHRAFTSCGGISWSRTHNDSLSSKGACCPLAFPQIELLILLSQVIPIFQHFLSGANAL